MPQAVPNSFAEWMNATDYDFVITHPEGYELAPEFVGNAKVEYDQMKAFEGADFVYAKNWAAYAGNNYGQILSKDRTWTVSDRLLLHQWTNRKGEMRRDCEGLFSTVSNIRSMGFS